MFAAIITRAGTTNPQALASGEALLAALFPFARPDASGTWSNERALIAHGVIHNTPESLYERAPEVCPDTGRVIASWARIDNREELCAQLGLSPHRELTDPQLILAAHRAWGRDCIARLEGDFSFVIHDPASGETFCGRDALGAKPFYYVLSDELFVAATSIAAIKAVASLTLTPSIEWTALLVAAMPFATSQGAYDEVRKLPPAHDMVVPREGRCEPREYFTFDLEAPHATERDPHWVELYREAFDRAVAVRARSSFLVGADNSGGLDSASVIASLIESLPHDVKDLHTFSLIAMEREPELVDAVSRMCGVGHTHRLMLPEMMPMGAECERALTALGHPPEHGQLLSQSEFFAICQSVGIRTILSGFGGDEVVTSYSNHLIDELHQRRAHAAMFAEMHGPLWRRAGRFAKQLWRGPADPDIRGRAIMETKLDIACLSREFLEDSGLARRIEDWFLPRREQLTLNSYAALEAGFRCARAGRLESSAIYGAAHAVEYRFPMFDRALIQQFFATPSIEKRHGEMGRYLHRRAMEGRIPRSIQWQKTKDVGGFIGGDAGQHEPLELGFDDLPPLLREVLDRSAFEQSIAAQRLADDQEAHTIMRRQYWIWQLRQAAAWLSE